MAATPAIPAALTSARTRTRLRVGAVPALAIVVGASAALRAAAAWLRATPTYIPDEYMYAELARSIAETGRPLIRGVEASFPALLQPVVTAPLWLAGDVETSFRLVQLVAALVMSLAAPVVYLLARRLGLSYGLALGSAVLAVSVPDLLYAGYVIAEPFAYPLALGAATAAVFALTSPSRRAQLAFVALTALATFARAQLALLVLVFVVAVLVAGLRERRLRAALREQALPLGIFGAVGLAAVAVGRERLFGIYSAPFGGDGIPLLSVAEHLGPNLLVFAYAAGWMLVPGGAIGLALALARPRSRAELAFGAVVATLAAGLFMQAALFGEVDKVQERYLFYAMPLLGVAFALFASRGWPHRRAHAVLVGVLLVLSARFPLSGLYTADAKEHSPMLIGVSRLEVWLGSPAAGSAFVAAGAALLCAAAIAGSFRPRLGTPVAFVAAAAIGTSAWLGAVDWDVKNATNVAASGLPADRSFVDSADVGPVAVLLGVGAQRVNTIHAFWNRSIERVLLLPGAGPSDPFTHEQVRIGRDGTLSVRGEVVRGALLVDEFATTLRFREAERLQTVAFDTLLRPRDRAQLALAMFGRYFDGWLASRGEIDLYPRELGASLAGTLTLRLRAPEELGSTTLVVTLPGGDEQRHTLRAGREIVVSLPVCSTGPWHAEFRTTRAVFLDGRVVGASAEEPVFTPAPGSCSSSV